MQLLKSLSAASTKAATPALRSNEITRDVLQSGQIKIVNNQVTLYGSETAALIRSGYLSNGDLYAIVNYILQKALRARFFLYEVKDEKALSDFRLLKGEGATQDSIKKSALLRTKALVDTTNPQIEKLLSKPNPEQSFKQFAENAYAYKLLTGERFIQKIAGLYPVTNLFVLPPTLMEVSAGDRYLSIGGYNYTATQTKLKPEEVQFSRTFYPALDGYGDELRGLSPLRVMALAIQKSNEAGLSGIRQYQNGGPPGILSLTDEGEALTTEQAEQYEAKLARKGGSANRGRINITGMKAEWVEMGLSPVDMDILQSGLFDLRALCRGYGVDSKLFGDPSSSTYSNMAEARKAAIVDAVIPAIEGLGDDLNCIIEPFNVKGKRYYIDADVTHFPEMAEDMNALADRLSKLDLTPNEKREAMQYERIAAPLMDEPWFDSNKTPLSHFSPDAEPADPNKSGY